MEKRKLLLWEEKPVLWLHVFTLNAQALGNIVEILMKILLKLASFNYRRGLVVYLFGEFVLESFCLLFFIYLYHHTLRPSRHCPCPWAGGS